MLETASLPEMPEEFEPDENSHHWHDAEQIREEVLDLFSHGIVDLKTRAEIEAMYWSVCHEIHALAKNLKHVPEELMNIDKLLADKYFCNFSLFIQRLNERPTRNATIQDITCDSDGKIANFATNRHNSHSLPVHTLKKNEKYYLGVFLVGAYQEILGDMHNLFGDTTAVHISVKDGKYHIDQIFDGETVEESWRYGLPRASRTVASHWKRARSSSRTTAQDSMVTLTSNNPNIPLDPLAP